MASKTVNNFHLGLAQDDHKSWGRNFIDSKNLTWLSNGYWVTLWPKVNKLVYSDEALRWLTIWPVTFTPLDERNLAFWDNWEVYNLWLATDNVPTYTFTNNGKVRGAFVLEPNYYFLYESTPWSNTLNLAQVAAAKVYDWTFTWINETFLTNYITHFDNPPIISTTKIAYIWGLSIVKNIDAAWTPWTDYTWVNRYVTWLTKHMTQFVMYTSNNEAYYATETAMLGWWVQSWSNILDFQPRRAIQTSTTDYIVTREWELQVWSWASTQRISKKRQSKRLNDNSAYKTIFNFDPWTEVAWNMMTFAESILYIAVNDSTPWIMAYWKLTPWVPDWFHKVITTASTWEALEKVYAIQYEHSRDRVYFTYKTATKYWVDYIDLSSKETTQSWYWVTEVFSANTAYIKKPSQIRLTASNTSWANYVKEYIRVNDWAWELIQNINDANDIIDRYEVKAKFNKNNIDIQFKIELYNDTQWTTAPLVQELLYNYIIIPK